MNASSSEPINPGRVRRIQERTEIARANLISAGVPLFSEQGFDAVSVRDIEVAADVKRGMLAYHFGDKETFWKAVADFTFEQIDAQRDMRLAMMKDISDREGLALMIRFYVRFYAQHPELSRLMAQEARQESWRLDYLVVTHIRPGSMKLEQHVRKILNLSAREFAHWYYILLSASATIFSFEPECKRLFGFNPRNEDVIETHADMIINMLLGQSK
ncbi:MAG: TetR family transcriptional regulator [Pseudomonadales bacterium]|jgi:TetR/AcrR family transcriptional regulator|tara:strand:- start:66 stop:713 length:648 start_codon:yes stop_codon:yes gene_type:complete